MSSSSAWSLLLNLTPQGTTMSRDEESKDPYNHSKNPLVYPINVTSARTSTLDMARRHFSASIPHKDHNNATNAESSDNSINSTKNHTNDIPDSGGDMRTRRDRIVMASQLGAKRGKAMAKQGAITTYQKVKQYGPVFVVTYGSLYLITLSSIYVGVDSGTIDPVTMFSYISSITTGAHDALGGGGDIMGGAAGESAEGGMEESKTTAHMVIEYLQHYSLTRPVVPFLEKNPHFANLGVAWVATKFTEPIRLVVAMAIVPKLADYFGYKPQTVENNPDDKDHEHATTPNETVMNGNIDARSSNHQPSEPQSVGEASPLLQATDVEGSGKALPPGTNESKQTQ
jgi:Protein of unknown function (DUF1279)